MDQEQQDILEWMKDWGYLLLHKPHPMSPGYRELLVALRKKPTGMHFDPEKVRLWVRDEYGCAHSTEISLVLLKLQPEPTHICPGPVALFDRKQKRVDFFTFGGTMRIVPGSGEVVCALRSPVPILRVPAMSDEPSARLAIEVEALMGKAHAEWGQEDEGYLRRVAEVDPFLFYVASLNSILIHYEEHVTLREEDPELHDLLHQEKEWLEESGRWPLQPPILESLLGPKG